MRALLLALLLCSPVAAQERDLNVRFQTHPPGAQVVLLQDATWNPMNGPVRFRDHRKLVFKFFYPTYRPGIPSAATQEAEIADFDADGNYRHGPIRLNLGADQWLAFYARRWGWAVILGVATVGLGLLRLLRSRSNPGLSQVQTTSRSLGRFVLGNSLGSGGFGQVFLSHNESGEEVAIKVLRPELSQDEESKKRFFREIKVLCSLDHPNIIHIYDWGEDHGAVYLVMEYLVGETLGTLLERNGRLTHSQLTWILPQLSAALTSLHERGLVHRDIKPDNVFLQTNGRLKLMDFGTALSADLTRATQTGMSLGTPTFMAPEQLAGELTPASDQYALGVLLFIGLTGRRPFEGLDAVSMAYAHAHQMPPRPSQLYPGLPLAIDEALMRMLAKKPEQRFATVLEAATAVELALSQPLEEGDEATQATSFDGTTSSS